MAGLADGKKTGYSIVDGVLRTGNRIYVESCTRKYWRKPILAQTQYTQKMYHDLRSCYIWCGMNIANFPDVRHVSK